MKKNKINSFVGIWAIVIGLCWVLLCLIGPIYRFIVDDTDWIEYVFLFPMMILFTLPGIFLLYCGFRLTKDKNKKNIKKTVGAFSFISVFFLAGLFLYCIEGLIEVVTIIPFLIATLFIIPVYASLAKFLIIKENLTPVKGEFVGKGIVLIVAWQIWLASYQLVDCFVPAKEGFTHIKEEPWMSIGVFGSILIAIIFYKIAMFIINKRNVEQKDHPNIATAPQDI